MNYDYTTFNLIFKLFSIYSINKRCKKDEGLYKSQCYKDAPPKTYLDNGEFKPCHLSCEACKGGLETDCTACKSTDF